MTGIKLDVKIKGSMSKTLEEVFLERAAINRDAIEKTAITLRDRWRGQIREAGLGARLEKAVRVKTYPSASKPTLHPAAMVYSRANKIHLAFNEGSVIHAKNGSRYLAIPTDDVPLTWSHKRMTPLEVESHFNHDLDFIPHGNGRPGGVLVMRKIVRAKNKKGYRQATTERLAQGRKEEEVIMFSLVPMVRLPKKLDFAGPEAEAQAELYRRIAGET